MSENNLVEQKLKTLSFSPRIQLTLGSEGNTEMQLRKWGSCKQLTYCILAWLEQSSQGDTHALLNVAAFLFNNFKFDQIFKEVSSSLY